jgi:hypothetical protein
MSSDKHPIAFDNGFFNSLNRDMELAHTTQQESLERRNGESNSDILSQYHRSGSRAGEK